MSETIFITGILGQDGAYLAEHALKAGHRVIGGVRKDSARNLWRLAELQIDRDVELVDLDLLDHAYLRGMIESINPSRVFNLAAQSFVVNSFEEPLGIVDAAGMGVLRLLEAIRQVDRTIRFFQASTSEMFGHACETPQRESTPFFPRSPYGVAKVFAHQMARNYREAYALHVSSGILFNHESPLRGEEFVTRKVTAAMAKVAAGRDEVLMLGNLDAKRDWGHARDYVQAMWAMTDREHGDEFVLATGRTTLIREFVRLAAAAAGVDLDFEGFGVDEVARDRKSGKVIVRVNKAFYRPAEGEVLIGDPTKARNELGWSASTSLEHLVEEMVEADRRRQG